MDSEQTTTTDDEDKYYSSFAELLTAKHSGELDRLYPGAVMILDNDTCVLLDSDDYEIFRQSGDFRDATDIFDFLGIRWDRC